jgi:hypothetical protein
LRIDGYHHRIRRTIWASCLLHRRDFNKEAAHSGGVRPTAYRTAEAQQAAQPMDGPARRLATHMLSEFFAAPILSDRPLPKLVIDNDRETAP